MTPQGPHYGIVFGSQKSSRRDDLGSVSNGFLEDGFEAPKSRGFGEVPKRGSKGGFGGFETAKSSDAEMAPKTSFSPFGTPPVTPKTGLEGKEGKETQKQKRINH